MVESETLPLSQLSVVCSNLVETDLGKGEHSDVEREASTNS